jgi:polyhydroxyalkanoate synthesis regulator phasin
MAGDDTDRGASRSDAVRKAVDQAFQATAGQAQTTAQTTRDRAQELVDDLAQAAGRVREALDDLRPPTADDLRSLREDLDALERRVARLEEDTPKPRARRSGAGR